MLALLNEIEPTKDIDSLSIFAPRTPAPQQMASYASLSPTCPMPGSRWSAASGFVGGSGVVALLRQGGHVPMLFEDGDDLRRRRPADVVLDVIVVPHVVTPVPGGIGPVEMAVLAERVMQQEAAPGIGSWHFHALGTQHSDLTTARADVIHEQHLSQEPEALDQ